MSNRAPVIASAATTLVTGAMLGAPVAGQVQPPPSALVNQGAEATVEAARAASPRTSEQTLAYFEHDVDAALARAVERVWDPERPREPSPRTPWGHPDLQGYWVSASYTPLERPPELAGKPLYSLQEAIEAFQTAVLVDASVDPATVHYDWTEFGMDNWQSPMRPNRRTSLIVDPPNGRIPHARGSRAAASACQARYVTVSRPHGALHRRQRESATNTVRPANR